MLSSLAINVTRINFTFSFHRNSHMMHHSIVHKGPLFNHENCMQGLANRVRFPAVFNRPYRCVVAEVQHYTMEELGSFLWVGSMIAKIGPPGFRKLWQQLCPALKHYLYNHDATQDECDKAADRLWQYAVELEELVFAGQVLRSQHLSWNMANSLAFTVCMAMHAHALCVAELNHTSTTMITFCLFSGA
jgi:hypothetical protein